MTSPSRIGKSGRSGEWGNWGFPKKINDIPTHPSQGVNLSNIEGGSCIYLNIYVRRMLGIPAQKALYTNQIIIFKQNSFEIVLTEY